MNIKNDQILKAFTLEFKQRFPRIIIFAWYDETDGFYCIHHNYERFEEDEDFCEKTCMLLDEHFYKNDLYSVDFVFDSKLIEYKYTLPANVRSNAFYDSTDCGLLGTYGNFNYSVLKRTNTRPPMTIVFKPITVIKPPKESYCFSEYTHPAELSSEYPSLEVAA